MASDKYIAIVNESRRKVVLYNKKGEQINEFPFQISMSRLGERIDITMFLTDDYLVFIETETMISKQIRVMPQKQLIHIYSLINTDDSSVWPIPKDISVIIFYYFSYNFYYIS